MTLVTAAQQQARVDPAGGAPGGEPPIAWHSLPLEDVLRRLATAREGLSEAEAARRLAEHGPNRLSPAQLVSALRILANQFASLVVLLLVAAALVSALLGDLLEAGAIGVVLAIDALMGFVLELRARRAMDALLHYEAPVSKVVRGGSAQQISSALLVPGDVIQLHEGDRVPADARLLDAAEVHANEAPLTGESLPVHKTAEPVADADALLAERASMVYSGTTIYVGRALAVVVSTGLATEIGRIGTLVSQVETSKTPLETRLDELGARLVWLTLGVAAVVTGLGVVQGAGLGRMVQTGIALAIAAVPEGLPAVATIALAVGLRRMAHRHALVRRLSAVEALGSTTVVCTDKTGTLTAGEMTVTVVVGSAESVQVTGTGFTAAGGFVGATGPVSPADVPWLRRLLVASALTSRASLGPDGKVVGDPTDAALTVLARKAGIDATSLRSVLPATRDIPFTSARRSSASVHLDGDHPVIFAKGAPATVLEWCTRRAVGDTEHDLDDQARRELLEANERLAARGLRVIALATGPGEELRGLTFLGLVGIMDPPAEGVRETIALLRGAGIRTVVITGDQRATAEAVARDLGAFDEGYLAADGRELRSMTDQQIAAADRPVGVFSRVSTEDKLRIVSALQAQGEVVAMLGDGVNDAAALKKADIGVAMGGRGTDVAMETADIVLRDDRFQTVGAAVEEGRVIFENIRKFVFYLFSCNLAEVLVLLVAGVAGLPLPLLPLQILWLNLVTDTFPALALALEPAEPGVMRRPPRDPDAALLSGRFLRAMLFYAGLITLSTLAAYVWGLESGSTARAVTLAFMTLALAQLFHLGNARARGPVLSFARATANPWALAALPIVVALQVLAVYWGPLAVVLRTEPLSLVDWAVVFGLSGVPAVIGQLVSLKRREPVSAP